MSDEHEDQIAALLRMAGPRPRVDAERTERVRAQVHAEWQDGLRRRARSRWLGVAAAVVMMIAAAALFVRREQPALPAAPPAAIVAEVRAIHGTVSLAPAAKVREGTWIETFAGGTLSLDWNGSTLRMDEGTRVRLDSARAATLERGAVYFDGSGANIVIRTALGEIRDVGTRFEARLDGGTLHVRVRDGRVDVRGTIAEAGMELVADRTSVRKNPIPVTGPAWQWIENAAPPIALEGLTLHDALARIAHEKGLRLELRGVGGETRLHGRVPFTPDEALDAATAATASSYRIEGDALIVRRR